MHLGLNELILYLGWISIDGKVAYYGEKTLKSNFWRECETSKNNKKSQHACVCFSNCRYQVQCAIKSWKNAVENNKIKKMRKITKKSWFEELFQFEPINREKTNEIEIYKSDTAMNISTCQRNNYFSV